MTIEEKQKEFLEKLDIYEDEFDKYGYVIFLGSQLEPMPEEWKTDENLYAGCLSKIWIHKELKNGRLFLSADSDTLIVKGLLYIWKELLQGHTLEEINHAGITLFDDLDMESVLNETRRNGMKGLTSWILDELQPPVTVLFLNTDHEKPDAVSSEVCFQKKLIQKELDRYLTRLGYQVIIAEEPDFGDEAWKDQMDRSNCILIRVNENWMESGDGKAGQSKKEKDSFHVLAKPADECPRELLSILGNKGIKQASQIVLLEGESMHGCLYAVYDFLEELGMRFYIQEDVFPGKAQEKKIGELNLDHSKKPLFEVRGLLPFHDFPEGPDWWERENYNRIMMQLTKMKGNFLGYHTYPENEKEPDKMTAEPLVWIGLPKDVEKNGQVKSAYPVQHFRTEGDSWGYHPGKTSEYLFGLGHFFTEDDMAASYMKHGPGKTYQKNLAASRKEDPEDVSEKYRDIFQKSGLFFADVFQEAHRLGIQNCIGTETPLTIPETLQKRIKSEGGTVEKKALYEGMFKRIGQLYPLDYYWMWTPEDWTWKGNTPYDTQNTIEDVTCALQAKKELGAKFELAMCGWTLGPQEDRVKFDQLFPKEMPFSCINRHLGFDPVEESFQRVTGRAKWAAPWLEDDPALLVPQLWVKRIRKDAFDAKEYGCNGLIGIHWRTETIGMNIRALLDAAWEQNGWKSEEREKAEKQQEEQPGNEAGNESAENVLAGVEAYIPESVTQDRILLADDFYKDFGIHYFGLEELGALLCRLDSQLPRPCRWENGPGNIYLNELPLSYVEHQYEFVDEWEKVGERILDLDAKERWEIWLARFQFMRECARLGCHMAIFEKLEDPEELKKEAEQIREIAGNVAADCCNFICSMGDMGNLAALVQRNLLPFKKKIDEKLRAAGCEVTDWEQTPDKKIKKRCVCLSEPSYLKKTDTWNVKVLATKGAGKVSLYWHPLHDSSNVQEIKLVRVTDFIFCGAIPTDTFSDSFCYQFALDGEKDRKKRTMAIL